MTLIAPQNVVAVVLAAGASRRFGSTKQLAQFGGIPLVAGTADIAFETCGSRAALVIGHDWQAVRDACEPWQGFLLVNDDYEQGLGTSISLAARSLQHAADALIMILADQPFVTTAHVRSLIDKWSGADNEIVATEFSGTLGPPVLFASGCFDELAKLCGDSGARQLLEDPRFNVEGVLFEDAAIDIDSPEDLDAQRSQLTQPE